MDKFEDVFTLEKKEIWRQEWAKAWKDVGVEKFYKWRWRVVREELNSENERSREESEKRKPKEKEAKDKNEFVDSEDELYEFTEK